MATQDMKAKLVIETSAQGNGDIVKLRDELDKLAGSADQAGPEFGALAAEINKLGAQQAAINGFGQLKAATADAAARTQQLQQATRDAALALKEKQAALEAATAAQEAQSAQLAQAREQQSAMEAATKQLSVELKTMAQEAKASGDSSAAMAQRLGEGKEQLAQLKAQCKSTASEVSGFAQAQRDSASAAKTAQRETNAAQKEFDNLRQSSAQAKQALAGQTQELQRARDALGGMGISSKDLADAQVQLNTGLDASRDSLDALAQKAQEAAAILANRELLGVVAHAEVQKEIEKTRQAYEELRASGALTNAELAQAAMEMELRVRQLQAQTDGWAGSLEDVATAVAGVVASGAGIAVVVNQAIKFESAMADVEKVVNASQEQMAQLSGHIKDMTASIPMAATELAGLAAAGGQLGIPLEKLREFIDLSAVMATAFGMSAEQAGQAVAKLSNVFRLPLEEVRKLGDAINVLGNTMAAKESDIVDVLTRIGGTAQQFGLTAQQASALGASMLSLGVSAEVAGTGINAILSKLQTAGIQGKDFQLALGSMGVSAKQLAKDIRDNPQKALSDFLETLSKLEGGKKAEVLARLFGAEYQDDVARLVGGLDDYTKALKSVGDAALTTGAMQKEFETRLKTTDAQIKLLNGSIGTLSTNLGSILLPVIRPLIAGLADGTGALAKFAEQFPGIAAAAVTLTTLAASAGALGLAFAALRVAGVKSLEAIAAAFPGLITRMGGAQAAAGKLQIALARVGVAGAALGIGWDIGTYARKEFLAVEKAGIYLAQGLAVNFALIESGWERLKAVFTDDTVVAAQERLRVKLGQINAIFAQQRVDAEEAKKAQEGQAKALEKTASASDKVSTAVQAVTTKMQELAASTQAAGQSAQATSVQLEQVFAQAIKGAASVGVVGQLRDKLQEAQAAGQLTADAAARLRVQLDQMGTAVGGVEEVVAQFRALKDSSEGVQGAVDALVKSLDINDKGSVAVFAKALQELGRTGALSAQQVDAAWQQALGSLNTRQLDNFALAVKVAFAQGTLSAQEFAQVNEQILAVSFDKLGVNAAQALGKISEGAQEAISSIDLVAESAKAAGVGVQDAARAIEMSFAAAIPKADSLQAIDALEQKLKAMGAAGQIGAEGIERTQAALDKQRSTIEEQIPGIQSLTEALQALGVTPQAELKALAATAKEAFEVVKASASASAADVGAAFAAAAEKAIAANNGLAPSWVKAEAAARGYKIEMDAAGKETLKLVNASQGAAQALKTLGIDADAVSSKISGGFKDASASVDTLQKNFGTLQSQGVNATDAITLGLNKMLEAAKNQADLNALKNKVEELRGVLGNTVANGFLEQATKKADELKAVMDEATPGINSAAEAFKALGITSDKELKQTAATAKEAFEAIKNSGTASPREISDAWKAMAEASIAANDGVADAAITSGAAAQGFAIEVDDAGKASVKALGQVKEGFEKVDYAAQMAGKSVEELQAIKAQGWNIAEDIAEAARLQNAATNALTNEWRKANVEADEYYSTLYQIYSKHEDFQNLGPWALEKAIWEASAALKELDAQQQAVERSSGDAAGGLASLEDRLLELSGTEEQVAARRKERDQAEVQQKLALLRLDLRRAEIMKDTELVAQLNEEISAYNQQLRLIEQIAAKEKETRDTKRREEEQAAKERADRETKAAKDAKDREAQDRKAQADAQRERQQEEKKRSKEKDDTSGRAARGEAGGGGASVTAAPAPINITLNANGINDPVKLARLLEPELKKLSIRAR